MMTSSILEGEGLAFGPVIVRLARSQAEIEAAQKLRYDVFYREFGALPADGMEMTGRDSDLFDAVADHLIVIDTRVDILPHRVVGTYRLIRQDVAEKIGGFYTRHEYDISPLLNSCDNILELGRSCVHRDYRTRPVMQLLWQAIAEYIAHYNIELLFGCASFHGTDINAVSEGLAYLHHNHRAPEDLCPQALPSRYRSMNLRREGEYDPRRAFAELPALIKGYLRLGGFIGDGAVIDEQFNTIDVCVIVKTGLVSDRYRKHYERKTSRPLNENAGHPIN